MNQIRTLLQDPRWQDIESIANRICDQIAYESTVRDSEWETTKTTLINEGQVQGIKRLLKQLYEIAQQ